MTHLRQIPSQREEAVSREHTHGSSSLSPMEAPHGPAASPYAQQAAFDIFLEAQKGRLLDSPEVWLRYNKLHCEVSSDTILQALHGQPGQPQAAWELGPPTHTMEYLTYNWNLGMGKFVLPRQPTPVDFLPKGNLKVAVNFHAGALNVITVMTQSRVHMTAPNNYIFKGVKLVPTQAQRENMAPPYNAGLFMKTTQTSGCWLGFGVDTAGDGATWAIHIQKLACGGEEAIDMYGTSQDIRIDMGNGNLLGNLTWLTPYMYYFDLFRNANADDNPADQQVLLQRNFMSQIMGIPVGNSGNTAVPTWRFCIQLFKAARPIAPSYTVLQFDMAQVGVQGAVLVNRPNAANAPYYGQLPPDPPTGGGPDTPPADPLDQLP